MKSVIDKLQIKPGAVVGLLSMPAEMQPALAELWERATVEAVLAPTVPFSTVLAFAIRQQEVEALAAQLPHAPGDVAVWVAYPKGTSKKYHCEFNRDTGWAALGAAGFEPVSQVAIDEDWSALRFRRVEYIKKMTRKGAISASGQARIAE
ncbi:hypothetical protein F0P96_01535 [Hymenobacter busanensis]|uniref:Uncharacterized protein n=1 Tax=Hymenobacter busanensis TaxID=2607656 RepID=A0A7L4ZVA8_9BACT|nr:hypothetical protein [Hymenobacter busanensis]KAA9339335.1 hypothetical protein F0P96_01535 [Hymenobacter busanensis]QHJ06903.1 hypothetical protein GUY19_06215 [Hymenobacter busanensis]